MPKPGSFERQTTHGLATIQVTFLQRQGQETGPQVNRIADDRLFWVPSVLPYNTTPSSMGRPGPGAEPVSQLAGHFAFAGGFARDRLRDVGRWDSIGQRSWD